MTDKVVMITLANPGGYLHGGAVRLRGFESAIKANGYEVEIREIAQAPTGEHASAMWRLLGRAKRQLLPLPLVRRQEVEVATYVERPWKSVLLSTVPTVTYALSAAGIVVDWADYHDLPARFAASEAEARSGVPRLTALGQSRALARHHTRTSALTRVSTYAGYGDYIAAGPSDRSYWIPPLVIPPRVPPPVTSGRIRTAGFLGNFRYWPNVDALAHLVQNWLEPLNESGFEVVVGGFGAAQISGLPPQVRNLGELGTPEDFYAQVDVVLVPVRRGSGIKVKAMEGLLSGRPVLVDPHVLDGFPPEYEQYFEVFRGQRVKLEALLARSSASIPDVAKAGSVFGLGAQTRFIGQLLSGLSQAGAA
jgi:glycosyltransferase involved in cell wall biosynthesis